jgi:hypothetical protein
MRKFVAILAVPGFAIGVYIFFASFLGLTLDKLGARAFLLHLGVFVFMVPLIAVERAGRKGQTPWRRTEPYQGKPRWAVQSIQILGLLCIGIFVAFLIMSHGAAPEIKDGEYVLNSHGTIVGYITEREYRFLKGWELRLFASGWMFFYYVAIVSWWFPRKEETPWALDP